MRAVAVRVGRSTGAVDARMDDYSDFDRDLSTAALLYPPDRRRVDARRLDGEDRERREDDGDYGGKVGDNDR